MAKSLLGSAVCRVLVPGRSAPFFRRAYSAIYEDVDVFKGTAEESHRVRIDGLSVFELLRPAPEILILGCGKTVRMLGPDVKDYLRKNGIRVEAVDSRNAASTFNFLNEEGRQVAAALLPTSA